MTLAGAGLTSTLKFTPARAELVPVKGVVLVVRLTSVRRPITADGRMTNTLPLPLLVLMPTLNPPTHKSLPWPVHATVPSGWRAQLLSQSCPPMIWPPDCRTQWLEPPLLPQVKFPLLWAKAALLTPSAATRRAT